MGRKKDIGSLPELGSVGDYVGSLSCRSMSSMHSFARVVRSYDRSFLSPLSSRRPPPRKFPERAQWRAARPTMNPRQLAESHCANYQADGSCLGVHYSDDGSISHMLRIIPLLRTNCRIIRPTSR